MNQASATELPPTPGGVLPGRPTGFEVHLDNFEGPFDLLLGLISKHKLDVTEIALASVTDEFISWIKAKGGEWDLGEASEFLLIAATLLDLKAARLLPAAQVEDDEDLALLEARDLLFARLLQYRAFKDVAASFATALAGESRRFPRSAGIEPQFAQLLPELVLGISPEQFAAIAARAMQPKAVPLVGLEHLHAPAVSVREQAAWIVQRLRKLQSTSFRTLTADAESTLVVVARFLALLELFRDGVVAFDQAAALGELTIRWTGSDDDSVSVENYDDYDDGEEVARERGDDDAERAAGEPGDESGDELGNEVRDGPRDEPGDGPGDDVDSGPVDAGPGADTGVDSGPGIEPEPEH